MRSVVAAAPDPGMTQPAGSCTSGPVAVTADFAIAPTTRRRGSRARTGLSPDLREGSVMAVTTTTSTSAPAVTKRLGLAQYAGYASGDAANNLAFSMSSLFLLLYYTDVVGLSAAAVGTMFLVV